jgi:E1A/CREB-binding protein
LQQIIQLSEDSEQGPDGKKKGQKKAKKSNKSKAAQRKSSKKHSDQQTGNDLSAKIFATMEKHKEVFFVIRLHSAQSAASLGVSVIFSLLSFLLHFEYYMRICYLQQIQDPDPLINCDLMDGRDAFLTMARDRHYEFSSMRRAQFSTLCMLWELHNQGQDKFVYTCNSCKTHVETRYHCTVCDDFDLCIICYEKDKHPHRMEKLGFDLDDGSSPGDTKQANPQEARKLSIQRCIQSLVHACQCRDANCRLPSCQKMKRVVTHTRICKRKTNGGCSICKQLIALCCYHAKHCQETKCPVPFCSNIKAKLKQQQVQQRLQSAQLLRRRMAVMNTTRTTTGMGSTGGSPPPTPATPSLASPPLTGSKPTPATHTPPPNVLQVVKQVQEEAALGALQKGPHYGKAAPQMPPPQQHMQRHSLHSMDQWGGPQRYPGKPQQALRPPHPMSQQLNHNQLAQMRPHNQHPNSQNHPQQQILNQQNNPQQVPFLFIIRT